MSVLPPETRVRVAAALVDGVGVRGAARLTGISRETVGSLLLSLGDGCSLVHASHMHALTCDVMELDEVWAFVGTKESKRDEFDPEEFGDAYTFVALDATSRAVVSFLTDKRTAATATVFAADIRARVLGKPQLSSDGFVAYPDAIERAFGTQVHYAKNLKTYAKDEAGGASRDDVRYSRGRCIASQKIPVLGSPDEAKITTSHVERSNLTTRMWCRRLTRLTSCFSRRLVFLRAALALHFAVYDFCREQSALRVTPAMQLGVTDHVWSMQELVEAALLAPDDVPPAVPPPVPPTPAQEAGARVRAAKRAAARKTARATEYDITAPTTAPAPTTTATVSLRRTSAARATDGATDVSGASGAQLSFNWPADGAEIAPRALPEPPAAGEDYRWLW